MDAGLKESIQQCIETGAILSGRITSFEYDDCKNTEVLVLDLSDIKAVIPREEFDLKDNEKSLKHRIGRKVKFIITELGENDVVYCSRKKVKEYERDSLIYEMEHENKTYRAKITHIETFGAYLSIRGVSVTLKNNDFAKDYTAVADVHKRGDKIEVKLLKVTDSKNIMVEAVEKYESPNQADVSQFYEGMKIQGRVKAVKIWGCYVSLAANLDVLVPIPEENFWIDTGNYVLVEIKKIDEETGRIRGKILKRIDEEDRKEGILL